jgi:hypothetical protein
MSDGLPSPYPAMNYLWTYLNNHQRREWYRFIQGKKKWKAFNYLWARWHEQAQISRINTHNYNPQNHRITRSISKRRLNALRVILIMEKLIEKMPTRDQPWRCCRHR